MQEELLQLWGQAKQLFVTTTSTKPSRWADRVAVLTTRPARGQIGPFTIDLPRPRNVATLRYDEQFIDIARRISRRSARGEVFAAGMADTDRWLTPSRSRLLLRRARIWKPWFRVEWRCRARLVLECCGSVVSGRYTGRRVGNSWLSGCSRFDRSCSSFASPSAIVLRADRLVFGSIAPRSALCGSRSGVTIYGRRERAF